MKFITSIAVGAALLFGTQWAHASKHSPSRDIIIVTPATLPSLAQQESQDLLLHSDGAGNTYLYLEQQDGARLAVLDVTDSAHIALAASVNTELSHPFDFVQAVGSSSELIRFRDSAGIAFLDLRHAKNPRVVTVANLTSVPYEMLGESGYLAIERRAGTDATNLQGRDVQVIDTSATPRLIATVAHATREVSRAETGTTFLLSDEGLTVIRRTDVEEQHAEHELSMRGN